ncbi:MAG: hypothetical protein HeimC2_08750 [Candidatus Heimdallarchaeota archaeon LC_2]|nr:MAG: hypothetical protein HeimC2_08750 [Candidatus Heimdallarchaeota archaeon LC_2]
MLVKPNIILLLIIFQIFSFSTILATNAAVGAEETPKDAIIGTNTGNISSNSAGGRYFFNFSTEAEKSYDFELNGDSNTAFDLFLFDITFLPGKVPDDSAEYAETNSYPVTIEGYVSEDSWVLIQVFSNHIDGGIGDFTLSISETSSSSSSTNTLDPTNDSDSTESPAFDFILVTFTMIISLIIINVKRKLN